ncbi:hypothetical protein K5D32_02415 [Pseudomonas cichorii]|uniref:hypothetical protein n=1 Tax=Pseudomonas cichorii TaxID=36746 RepID=UPI001C8AB957|nr:hypothetical protein [Pseudomonas cichorii]MBX8528496.1 hypothetical protein [Pseudomonas cichorii]
MSDMIEVRARELTGHALDYCTLVVSGKQARMTASGVRVALGGSVFQRFSPTTDSLLASEQIVTYKVRFDVDARGSEFAARVGDVVCSGSTIDIAACRAIVASRLGECFGIPRELMP